MKKAHILEAQARHLMENKLKLAETPSPKERRGKLLRLASRVMGKQTLLITEKNLPPGKQ